MASFLLRVLFCLGKRPRDPTIPDDRSRLIPASVVDGETLTGEGAGPNARAAFDHVIFKERLGCIVRSKEGKMVNVTSPLPFNLHNKPRALIDIMSQGSYMSSSSRSASTSTFHESQSPAPERRHTSRPPALRLRSGLRITPLHSEPPSRSTSRSRSSAPSSSKDVGGDDHDDDGGGEPVPERVPGVLGVRLVRGYDVGYGLMGRRGRAKVKKDAESEVGDNAATSSERARDISEELGTGPRATESDPSMSTTTTNLVGLPPEVDEQGHCPPPQPKPELSTSPASVTFEFRLHDAGALSASWGE